MPGSAVQLPNDLGLASPGFPVAVMTMSFVHTAIANMSHAERNAQYRSAQYRSAIADGDTRRADEIASAPIPDDWTEHERALWHARRAIARNRGQKPASAPVDPT